VTACSRVADVLCLAQDDVKRFISESQPPPSGIEIPVEGKVKERREVGEGDDTVVVEDTSDDDTDEETLQDRFQLRSRFSRPGLPHVPLVQDPPASLEASLAVPPRKPRNPARKRVTKKLKVSETTPQEVGCLEQSSRVLVVRVRLLTSSLHCMQEVPPAESVEGDDEGVWDTVGEPAGSRSPAPTVEELLAQLERQPPAPQGSTGPVAAAVEEVVASGAQETSAPAAAAVEEAVAAEAQEEAPAEGGLVDIASILGAPVVTIVRSNL
jgi:hypothetical protein